MCVCFTFIDLCFSVSTLYVFFLEETFNSRNILKNVKIFINVNHFLVALSICHLSDNTSMLFDHRPAKFRKKTQVTMIYFLDICPHQSSSSFPTIYSSKLTCYLFETSLTFGFKNRLHNVPQNASEEQQTHTSYHKVSRNCGTFVSKTASREAILLENKTNL